MKSLILLSTFLGFHSAMAYDPISASTQGSAYATKNGVKCPINVVPHQSLGPIKIGMNQKDLEALKLGSKVAEYTTWIAVGPFSAHIEGVTGKVDQVEARLMDLPDCVQIGSKPIALQSGLKPLQQIFTGCQVPNRRDNVDVTQCSGISIRTQGLIEEPQNLKLHIP
jgi:hypothetical protein